MKQGFLFAAALAAAVVFSAPSQAQLFGPSDEEKAATKAHEDGQDAGIADNARMLRQIQDSQTQLQNQMQAQIRDLGDRVRSLTDSLARATGANEELSHQISLLNDKIAQQQHDFDYRLCTISAQQLGADAQSLNCAAAGTQSAALPQQQNFTPGARLPALGSDTADGTPPLRGRGAGVLGTLPASGPPPRAVSADTGNDGPRSFDTAMNLLARAQYDEAGAAFRSYADNHPDDDSLSPQALYWVAHLAAMQKDYTTASSTFAEQIKKYPKSSRGPDSMLELGQVRIALGKNSEGCTFLGGIKKQYPNASASTLSAAANARKAANCR